VKRIILSLIAPFVCTLAATPASDGPALEVGQAAPPFSLQGSDGKTHSLESLEGKPVVIAWFPKAFTGG